MNSSRQNLFPVALFTICCLAQLGPVTSQVSAEDWPHWRGPNSNGITNELSGYADGKWPVSAEGSWELKVPVGGSSPLIYGGQVFFFGYADDKEIIACHNLSDGKLIWSQSYPAPAYGRLARGDQGLYRGPSGTPEFDPTTKLLYTLGSDGQLTCWDTTSAGKQVWQKNLYDEYKMPVRPKVGRSGHRDYGYTSNPLVYQDWLLVEVGGNKGLIVAFDKKTGKEIWGSEHKDVAGHSGGPAILKVDGVDCVATMSFSGLNVVRLDPGHEGETVGTYAWETSFANNIAAVAVTDNAAIITSEYNHGKMCKVELELKTGAKKVWEVGCSSKICTPVIFKDHVYFCWDSVRCLDLKTGEEKWSERGFGDAGSCIITGDERLLIFARRGTLALAETVSRSPGKYTELGRVECGFRSDVWPHLAFADGMLVCRDWNGNVKTFSVK